MWKGFMGLVTCRPLRDAERQTRQIDTQIRIDNLTNKKKVKMLLLGISDSGKSTIVKQMRVNYLDGFNETEIVNAIFVLLKLFAHDSGKIEMMQEVDELKVINTIRGFDCIKVFFERFANHPMVPDHIHYFLPNLERIAMPNYTPTTEDLIHMRQTTLGVHEISFEYSNKHNIRLIDVGGQKTERRKWIHFFEGVTAVMFMCSLSSFNQTTEEEPKSFVWESSLNRVQNKVLVRSSGKAKVERPGLVNRLDESVELFKSIRENSFLSMSNFMLLLNKVDLLTTKLATVSFADYFPDYKNWLNNDNSVASVAEFIESMFREGLDAEHKIYAHIIQATVTSKVEYTFALCCNVIFEKNIDEASLE